MSSVEQKARAMYEAQADPLAAPWERQWEPTKQYWREQAALREQPEARGVVIERDSRGLISAVYENGKLSAANPEYVVDTRTAAQQPVQEGGGARLTNPWTGEPRDYRDVNSDPAGTLCVEPGAPLKAAPPSAPVGLDPPVERQRDLLAQAIRDAAVKAGIARADADMTGPMLLMLCDDMADCILTQQPAQAAPGEFVVVDGKSYALDTVRTALLGLAADVAATPPGDDAAGGGHD